MLLGTHPQYRLEARPAHGRYECVVLKAVSGKPIDAGADVYPTADAAFAGGLERLKAQLGW